MSLVELLVVMVIILIVAAATIPRLRPEIDRNRIREAARSIQLYLSSARNQAMATGRSCGVQIERLPAENGCSMALTQVETPVNYGGDFTGSNGTVSAHVFNPAPQGSPQQQGLIAIDTWDPNSIYAVVDIAFSNWPSVPMFPGDQIQINYQGPWYTVGGGSLGTYSSPAGAAQGQATAFYPMNTLNTVTGAVQGVGPLQKIVAYVDCSFGQSCAAVTQATPTVGPYAIRREPVKSAAATLQLPSPACIDLTWSGIDTVLSNDTPTWDIPPTPSPTSGSNGNPMLLSPVIIMFSPNGSVDQVYRYVFKTRSFSAVRATSSIYLLVGSRESVTPVPDATNTASNVYNLTSLWIGINGSTGLTVVTDNMPCSPTPPAPPTPYAVGTVSSTCQQARTFARESSAMGGK